MTLVSEKDMNRWLKGFIRKLEVKLRGMNVPRFIPGKDPVKGDLAHYLFNTRPALRDIVEDINLIKKNNTLHRDVVEAAVKAAREMLELRLLSTYIDLAKMLDSWSFAEVVAHTVAQFVAAPSGKPKRVLGDGE